MVLDPDEFAESGRYLSRSGFICVAVSAGVLFLKEHASSSARTISLVSTCPDV